MPKPSCIPPLPFRRGDENRPQRRISASTPMNGGISPPLSFVGAMKIARTPTVSERHVEWHAPISGSLPEGAGSPQGLTEGVSSDGCFGPTVYSQFFIGSEIFERLRATKYTPSVSHSLDSSLREGAGNGWFHSTGCSLKSGGAGDFHRPYGGSEILTFHYATCRSKTSGFHRGNDTGWAGAAMYGKRVSA